MSTPLFPIEIQDTEYSSASALLEAFEERLKYGMVDHPGQSTPADHFAEAVSRDRTGRVEKALEEALRPVIETSVDETKLWMALSLFGSSCSSTHYRTLIRRLGERIGEPARESMLNALLQGAQGGDKSLRAEILAFFDRAGAKDYKVNAMIGQSSTADLLAAALDALKFGFDDQFFLNVVGVWLARGGDHDAVLRLAAAIADQPRETRKRFASGQKSVSKEWLKTNRASLNSALGL